MAGRSTPRVTLDLVVRLAAESADAAGVRSNFSFLFAFRLSRKGPALQCSLSSNQYWHAKVDNVMACHGAGCAHWFNYPFLNNIGIVTLNSGIKTANGSDALLPPANASRWAMHTREFIISGIPLTIVEPGKMSAHVGIDETFALFIAGVAAEGCAVAKRPFFAVARCVD